MIICPLCGSDETESIAPYRSASPIMANRFRQVCHKCTLVFAAPQPTQEEWSNYNATYFSSAHGSAHLTKRSQLFRTALGKLRMQFVNQSLGQNVVHSVVEVGPGFGEFAAAFRDRYPEVGYAAIETDPSVFGYLKKIGISIFDGFDAVKQDADLVVASHVLEHTLNPTVFLKQMAACLRPGGLLFVEVPCRDDLYKHIDEPHTLFFDKPALHLAAKAAGLTNIRLSYHGELRETLQSEMHQHRLLRLITKGFRILKRVLDPNLRYGLTCSERILIAPFDAHTDKKDPARWLRLLANKP